MSGYIKGNSGKTKNIFLEMLEPTEEDLSRKFTNEELIKLCLKRKCRVDMWKWNLAYEYRLLFEEEGRYQRWDDRKRLKMLRKGVNEIKATIFYTEEEIAETRRKTWKWEKKDCILSLNLWDYNERRQKKKEWQEHADETAKADNNGDRESLVASASQFEIFIATDTNVNNQTLINDQEEGVIGLNSTINKSALNFLEVNSDVDIEIGPNTQKDLTTMANNSDHAEGLFFDINTESMTIDSESLIASESEQLNTSLQTLHLVCYTHFENGDHIASTENPEF